MVKKIVKAVGIGIGILLLLAAGFYGKVYLSTEEIFNRKHEITLQPLAIPHDTALLAEGRRLIFAKGCNDCHGADLGGKVFIEDPALGFIVGPNLTRGKGGLPASFTTQQWLMALQHGLRPDSTTLLIMPSYEYTLLSEHDMRAIIAYGQQLPPVDRTMPDSKIGPLGRILTDLDKLPIAVADKIDHTRTLNTTITPAVNAEYGKYIAVGCTGCHKQNLKGGDPVIPGSPQVADITSAGHVGKWSEEQFITTLHTGVTPEGKKLDEKFMPWTMTKSYTATEIKALYTYLRSI